MVHIMLKTFVDIPNGLAAGASPKLSNSLSLVLYSCKIRLKFFKLQIASAGTGTGTRMRHYSESESESNHVRIVFGRPLDPMNYAHYDAVKDQEDKPTQHHSS